MKVAISIPDALCRRVDRTAKRLGVSRSQLLSQAAAELLEREVAADVTGSYDRAFAREAADEHTVAEARFRRRAARRALAKVEW